MTLVDLLGYSAASAAIGTHSMRTMIPLRVLALATNVLFIGYGYLSGTQPVFLLHLILFPLNAWRLHQMLKVLRNVSAAAASGRLCIDWLRPFGAKRPFEPGQAVFRAGDKARHLYVVLSGRFRVEPHWDVLPGTLLGELGFVAPDQCRTMTVRCVERGELLAISYADVKTLYFQSPAFAFYLLRLVSERLFSHLQARELGAKPALVSEPSRPAPLMPMPASAEPGARADPGAIKAA
jgi:CRP/FNR family transcriptional regulator, cyclic AMP receptor protein